MSLHLFLSGRLATHPFGEASFGRSILGDAHLHGLICMGPTCCQSKLRGFDVYNDNLADKMANSKPIQLSATHCPAHALLRHDEDPNAHPKTYMQPSTP